MSRFCITLTVAAIALYFPATSRPDGEGAGVVGAQLLRAEEALSSALSSAWRQACAVVEGAARRERPALHDAQAKLARAGVYVDLGQLGEDIHTDVANCAGRTQKQYLELLRALRGSVLRCWGWESGEVRGVLDETRALLEGADRLPADLRRDLDNCLAGAPGDARGDAGAGPSAFRMFRCSAAAVSAAMSHAARAPPEVLRLAKHMLALLAVTRDDFAVCAKDAVSQAARPAASLAKELGGCVLGRVRDEVQAACKWK